MCFLVKLKTINTKIINLFLIKLCFTTTSHAKTNRKHTKKQKKSAVLNSAASISYFTLIKEE